VRRDLRKRGKKFKAFSKKKPVGKEKKGEKYGEIFPTLPRHSSGGGGNFGYPIEPPN
jgi:hypothetical protein